MGAATETRRRDESEPESRSGWAMASLALSMMLASLGFSIPYVALPTIMQAFGVSFHTAQWVVIAYLLVITVLVVGVGRLGDALGHRRVLLAGLALYGAGAVICGLAPSFWALILGRAIQGLGGGALMALTLAMVRQVTAREKTGRAMGLMGTMSAMGTALGPTLAGFLTELFGWRAVFLILAPLALAALLMARRALPNRRPDSDRAARRFDLIGAAALGLCVAAYALAATLGDGRFGALNIALLAAAAVFGLAFWRVETRTAAPLIDLSLFHDRRTSGGLANNALVSAVLMATLVIGPFYLSRVLSLSEAQIGLVVSVGPILSAFSGVPAGRLVDRLGSSSILVVGLAAVAAGCLALAVLPDRIGLAGYVAAIAILTPGYQLFLAANNTAVMIDVDENRRGVVSGMLTLSRNIGLTTGASVMGAVFAASAGFSEVAAAPAEAVERGLRITFLLAAGAMALAAAAAFHDARRGGSERGDRA